MVIFANAKINLGLSVIERRPDGFHEIESVMVPVDWCDVLEVRPASKLRFESLGLPIPGNPADNLCLKAFRLLAADFDLQPVELFLQKNIPIGAGFGGGSADGTFALKAIADLFSLPLSTVQLELLAQQLGSDCPFFVRNRAARVSGRGEVLTPLAENPIVGWSVVLIYPNEHINTGWAYRQIEPRKPKHSILEIIRRPIDEWSAAGLSNDFEAPVFEMYPRIRDVKSVLEMNGAVYAAMTGSGSAVFGLFERGTDFDNLRWTLRDKDYSYRIIE